uniref:Uncharacterized protein n=1 Tax=Mycena chlorophos TaxID=658473 RepID=A0ABQ0MEM5_MYCCL|nr:predicted protein [Mycena chlorophos]
MTAVRASSRRRRDSSRMVLQNTTGKASLWTALELRHPHPQSHLFASLPSSALPTRPNHIPLPLPSSLPSRSPHFEPAREQLASSRPDRNTHPAPGLPPL